MSRAPARQRHPGRRPRCPAGRRWSSQADEPLVVRRPAGGQRPAEVHDLADARRARARRACSSATRTAATSPAACSGCTPRGTTRGRSWSGWPARRWSGSASETHETVHLAVARGDRVVQVAQVDSRYHPRHPRLDPDRRPAHTARPWARSSSPGASSRCADGPGAAHGRHPHHPGGARRDGARPAASWLGGDRRRARGRSDRHRGAGARAPR